MMVTPLKNIVLDWKSDRSRLIHNVVKTGGTVFYLYSEDKHDWKNPDYQGIEIYNIHSDLIDEKHPVKFLINGMINSGIQRHQLFLQNLSCGKTVNLLIARKIVMLINFNPKIKRGITGLLQD